MESWQKYSSTYLPNIGFKKNCSLTSLFTITGQMHPMMEKSKLKLGLSAAISLALETREDLKAGLLALVNNPSCAYSGSFFAKQFLYSFRKNIH